MLAGPLTASSPFSLAGNDDQMSCRPTADIEAFKSLLPPPVEFVEATTSTLAVAEGKYQAINETPKARPSKENNQAPPPSPSPSQRAPRRSSNASSAEPQSLHASEIDTSWPLKFNVGSGLYNNGNTCFLNSALQCLLHTPPLLRVIVQHHDTNSCRVKSGFCMSCSMRQVILRAHQNKSPFSPEQITSKLQVIAKHLRRGRQEDSHEFLRYAIDAFQRSCLAGQSPKADPKIAETTWVHKIFGGKLRSRVTCASCGHNSDTFDNNLDLSLDIFKTSSIREAFRKFFTPDQLKGSDKYKCEKCKKAVNAQKRFSIKEAPLVLTVHLKRFSPFGSKIGHQVDYESQISLKPYMSDGQYGPTYTLYGVICHAGGGPNSGHYYSFVKSREGKWYEMNDDSVSPYGGGLPVKKNAYILFYLRNKGDRLQSAIQQVPEAMAPPRSLINSMKKRKQRDGEDTGVSVSRPFIGPVMPSSNDSPSEAKKQKLSNGDPQADAVKKKIKSAQKSSLLELNQYNSDQEEGEDATVALEAPASTSDGPPTPTPVSTKPTPAPTPTRTPIPPAQFYGTPPSDKPGRHRVPPSGDWKHKVKHGFAGPYHKYTNKKKFGRPRPL